MGSAATASTATMGFFTQTLGVPAPMAFLVILAESVGAIALVLGLGTRLAAFGAIATMTGAILLTHLPHGFFMNWGGTAAGEGFEFHCSHSRSPSARDQGCGAYAVDSWLARKIEQRRGSTPLVPHLA